MPPPPPISMTRCLAPDTPHPLEELHRQRSSEADDLGDPHLDEADIGSSEHGGFPVTLVRPDYGLLPNAPLARRSPQGVDGHVAGESPQLPRGPAKSADAIALRSERSIWPVRGSPSASQQPSRTAGMRFDVGLTPVTICNGYRAAVGRRAFRRSSVRCPSAPCFGMVVWCPVRR